MCVRSEDPDGRVRGGTLDGQDASGPAAVPACARYDARVPRQPACSASPAGHASSFRAAHLQGQGGCDAGWACARPRPPLRPPRRRADDDRGVTLALVHEASDPGRQTSDGGCPKARPSLRPSSRRRSRLLRLPARADRSRSKRYRATPGVGLPLRDRLNACVFAPAHERECHRRGIDRSCVARGRPHVYRPGRSP